MAPLDSETRLNNGFVRWSPDGKRLAGVGIPGNRAGYQWIIDPLGPAPFKKSIDLSPDVYPRGGGLSARDGSSFVIGESRATSDIILAERVR